MKRDKLWYASSTLVAVGILLALTGSKFSFPVFILAAVLRPLLSQFPGIKKLTDEREIQIRSEAGDLAFITLILALTGACVIRSIQGYRSDEFYLIIAIGIVLRALVELFLRGDYYRSSVMVLRAIGILMCLFIVLSAGFHTASILGLLTLTLFFFLAWLVNKYPLVLIIALVCIIVLFVIFLQLLNASSNSLQIWLFVVCPLLFACICTLLGYLDERYNITMRQSVAVAGLILFIMLEVMLYVFSLNYREPKELRFKEVPRQSKVTIQGYPFKGVLVYHPNGKILSAILDSSVAVGNSHLPADTKLYFTQEGTLHFAFLPYDCNIDGYTCKGEGPENWQTVFYPTGALQVFWPANDVIIQGVPCSRSNFWDELLSGESSVHLFPNGRLQQAKLGDDYTVNGISYKKHSHIIFDSTGSVIRNY